MVAENTAVAEAKNEIGQLAARLALILLEGGSTAVFAEADINPVFATVEHLLLGTSTRVLTVEPPLDLAGLMRQLASNSLKGSLPGIESLHAVLTEIDPSCDRIVLLVKSAQELPFNTLRYLELALRAGPRLGILLAGDGRLEETLALPGFSSLRARLVRYDLGIAGTATPSDRDQCLADAPSLQLPNGLISSEVLATAEISKTGKAVAAGLAPAPARASVRKGLRTPASEPTASVNASMRSETRRVATARGYLRLRNRVGSSIVCGVAVAALALLLVLSRSPLPLDPAQSPHPSTSGSAAVSVPIASVPDAMASGGAASNSAAALLAEPEVQPTVRGASDKQPDEQLAAATFPQPAASSNEPAAEVTSPVEDAARSPEPEEASEAVAPLDRPFTPPAPADPAMASVGAGSTQSTGETLASRPAGALDHSVPALALPQRPGRPLVRPVPAARTTQYAALIARPIGDVTAHLGSRPDSQRCRDIVIRLQLGEDASNADRTFLRNGCH